MKDASKTKAKLINELEELRQRVAEPAILDAEVTGVEKRLAKISDCFLNFGTDPLENINCLTALCGELLGATCALYNRLDSDLLYSWGKWKVPPDYNPVDKPDGHICYDVIKQAQDQVIVVSNLPGTPYAQTDPNVIAYELQTYVGRAVKFGDACVGSLCVVYQDDFVPSDIDKTLMEIIASAIGVEEKRKQAEEALQESEEKFRTAFNNAAIGMSLVANDGYFLKVNRTLSEILGYSEEEFFNKTWMEITSQDDLEGCLAWLQKVKKGTYGTYEKRFIHKQGHPVWLTVSTSMVPDSEGQPLYYISLFQDVSKRKHAEDKVQESEERFQKAFHRNPSPMTISSTDGCFIDVNEAFALQFGYSREELIGQHGSKLGIFFDQAKRKEKFERLVAQGGPFSAKEMKLRTKTGEIRWGLVSYEIIEIKGEQFILGVGTDITERKKAEEALQQSEERFRAIFETAEDFIFIKDRSLKYRQVNPTMERLFDLPASKLIGRTDEDLFGEETGSHIREEDIRVLGGEIVEEEHIEPVKGVPKSFHVIKVPLRDSSGKIVGLCGIARDITERKEAEDALRTSEKRYRAIVEDQTELICRFSPDATLTFVNDAYCRYFRKTKEELLGFNFFDLIPAEDQQAVREHFRSLSPEKPQVTYEHRVMSPAGENRWQYWTDRAIFDEQGRLVEYQSVGHDITDLKLAEEKLRSRDAILVALAGSTKRCLEVTSLDEAIRGILQELGRATEVSRVYVFENHVSDTGTLLTSQRYEWVSPGITAQTDNPDTQNFPWFAGGMGRWAETLKKGEAVRGLVKDFPPSEQKILAPQGILSIVAVPIFLEQNWWGFIGFDECSTERVWSAAETEALKAAAATLGAIMQRTRMEEALRKSEEFNRIIIENIADRIFAKDTEGRYTLLTKVSYDFWRIPYGSALGKTDWDIHSPLTAEAFVASDRIVFETGESYCGQERAQTKDGRDLVLSVTKAPLKDATGKTTGLVGISRDITDIKRAEEALIKAQEELESRVAQRTAELVQLNQQLRQEIEERKQIEQVLRKREAELEIKTNELGEVNTALRVLLKQRGHDQEELEERIQLNVKELVLPYLERLKQAGLVAEQSAYLNILESNLNEIVAPFLRRLTAKSRKLTPTEIQVASLVKEGKTTKDIAELLYLSSRTVEFHRNNIRKKLGLNKSKVNLRSHLLSM
jgi:PAS domain S-box-containing protein